ncbi:MAG: winged helix-turn-helix transcriptional regulator [Dehalococcoidia bacterium]|nr:winged helix-turn-helix transcriptional regulator [Dehalococcoidia bacterium]
MTTSVLTVLTESDQMLIKELRSDARQSTRDLAGKLGISATTVSSKLRKMVADGIIDFAAIVDPRFFGFDSKVVLGVKTTLAPPSDVAKDLAVCKNIQAISLTTGRYDMVIYAMFHNSQDFLKWMSNELSRFDNIADIEVMTILHEVKDYYTGLSNTTIAGYQKTAPRCLEDSELRLIRELELNPRQSIGILGKRTGMTRQTTARKLKKLLTEKVVSVISHADLSAVGLVVPVYVFLKVKLDMIFPAAHTLAANTRVTHVAIVAGSFNLLAYMAFPNTEKMYRFLIRDLRSIPGVISYETIIQVGRSYRSYRLIHE